MAKGKKKKGAKKSRRVKWDENADIFQKKLLTTYLEQCRLDKSIPCVWLEKALKKGVEDRIYARKFIIEGLDVEENIHEAAESDVRLRPVIRSIRHERFVHVHEICAWGLTAEHSEIAELALLLEKGFYPVQRVELMDCDLEFFSVTRLAKSFRVSNLVEVNLDYNEFGDQGCIGFCNGLKGNKTMLSVSLCYCQLTHKSGAPLGDALRNTAVREFYLDGNRLGSDGVVEILRHAASHAEAEHYKTIEEEKLKALMMTEGAMLASDNMITSQINTDGNTTNPGTDVELPVDSEPAPKKKKKRKGKKKKAEAPPPVVGPYVHILHIADNGIDVYGEGRDDRLFSCIEVLKQIIMYSPNFVELDIDDNTIGDRSARQLLHALEERKLASKPGIKVRTSAAMEQTTYSAISKFAVGMKKKSKKGKKKKGKKKKK